MKRVLGRMKRRIGLIWKDRSRFSVFEGKYESLNRMKAEAGIQTFLTAIDNL
jgi:hypothetical protein